MFQDAVGTTTWQRFRADSFMDIAPKTEKRTTRQVKNMIGINVLRRSGEGRLCLSSDCCGIRLTPIQSSRDRESSADCGALGILLPRPAIGADGNTAGLVFEPVQTLYSAQLDKARMENELQGPSPTSE